MASRKTSKDGWTITLVSKDEAGQQLVLDKYKPFRLEALRLDPASFSSTLAREQAFADDVWTRRLMDPLNRLFLAVDNTTQEILSTVFLRRVPEPSSSLTSSDDDASGSPVVFGIYGLWTLPAARRQGIARHLLEEVTRMTRNVARLGDRDCRLEVEAYEGNEGALRLYREAGFEEQEMGQGGMRKFTLMIDKTETVVDTVA